MIRCRKKRGIFHIHDFWCATVTGRDGAGLIISRRQRLGGAGKFYGSQIPPQRACSFFLITPDGMAQALPFPGGSGSEGPASSMVLKYPRKGQRSMRVKPDGFTLSSRYARALIALARPFAPVSRELSLPGPRVFAHQELWRTPLCSSGKP